jgi:two-component system sensor histidine kinase/response regulator
MKGKASVSSMEGEGSTFRAQVPLTLQLDAAMPRAEGEERRLENVPVLVAGGQHVGRFVVSEWCRRWAMNVELCDTANVIRSMVDAAEQDRGFEVVIAEGTAETLGQAVFAIDAAAGDGVKPKVVLISSDTPEKTRYLEADAVLYSPVRSKALWKAISELGVGLSEKALSEAGHGMEVSQQKRRAAKYKVLVADDNLVNQRLTSALLSRMGCRVDVAENGLTAVQKVSENDYELVFMDCVMPEMDGFAAAKAIRNLGEQGRRLPIVALTASVTLQDRERCFAAGMDDFLTKPIHSAQLADCLSKWLKGFDQENESEQSAGC